mmetsp:Transcript_12678/g.19082  ORF Transcript_12678/g.19082 Transcript_12678/m.19082 type:complete len:480 (+) Transcript_12678:121-1560(+)|eukprot:CAMPEP_0196818342 /NCGR_PEP_ID=MMETSP1362-20130617/65122_1 /TAXON_ID=163516 /ORGANISM="Leptocylindrus danicus, Strain CCMP1856" /LENGTH=479 /DNA_ID=CAMNT_0042196405 /DNA_START=45 /DNA_END=1484 /DNA_ORIENTATION=+
MDYGNDPYGTTNPYHDMDEANVAHASPYSSTIGARLASPVTAGDIDEDDDDVVSEDDPNLPRILIMGPRRSGKTSIQRVVFQKMSPHETLFRLEPTNKIEKSVVDHTPLCRFQIWDFPGDYGYGGSYYDNMNGGGYMGDPDYEDEADYAIFAESTALVFVIDAQDEPYDHVLQNLTETVTRAYRANPHIAIEVFINKVDGELFLSDEAKYDCRRDIMQQVAMELADADLSDVVPIAYYLTSIYDHSIFEALSKVSQKLISQLPTLENLLNVLVSTCSMEKAFLFDVASKLYICTDSSPVDMQAVELCSDMIDVVLDVSGIYGMKPVGGNSGGIKVDDHIVVADQQQQLEDDSGNDNLAVATSGSVEDIVAGVDAREDEDADTLDNTNNTGAVGSDADADETVTIEGETSAYDSESASVIQLSNGMVLYLKEVDTMLALVCLTRSENFRKKSLINYNIGCLKKALGAILPLPLQVVADGS